MPLAGHASTAVLHILPPQLKEVLEEESPHSPAGLVIESSPRQASG